MKAGYQIGPFRLDPAARVLTQGGVPVSLGPRAVAVLAALVKCPHEFVAKENIFEAAWPGLVVEESNLAAQISAIRRVLARAPGGKGWIETLARRGYRFIGPVRTLQDSDSRHYEGGAPVSLPRALTSFIGRERELREVSQLLDIGRLVTLVGIGGIGKTRLAVQVARSVSGAYREGVRFVDLAPAADETAVPGAVARALGFREEPGEPLLELLAARVTTLELLLVLDNCEHVLDACARLVDRLLCAAPGLRILATSRESLHVAGERICLLPPMSLPDSRVGDDLSRSDAVRLFVERARLRCPDFFVNESNALAITKLCLGLDGLPLALELAAARLEVISVEQLAERLGDRFAFLTAGNRAAMPRQQTLHATIEWSYGLLTEPEKAFFACLAAFAGGWTLDAARAVTGAGGKSPAAALDLLVRLVEKSLVIADQHGTRYRMLDTIRQFAAEKLAGSRERDEILARHVRFYVDMAQEAESNRFERLQRSWLKRLELEVDNIAVAHAACERVAEGPELGLRLAAATRPFWLVHGPFETGLRMITEALERGRALPPSPSKAAAYIGAAQLGNYMGRNDQERGLAARGRSIARKIGHVGLESMACHTLANIARDEGDFASAYANLEAALVLARRSGSHGRIASILNATAELYRADGRLDASIPIYEEALSIAREQDVREFIAVILVNLSAALVACREYHKIAPLLSEALAIAHDDGLRVVGWGALEVAAMLAAASHEWIRAAHLQGAVNAMQKTLAVKREPHDVRLKSGFETVVRQALGEDTFRASIETGLALGYDRITGETAAWLGALPADTASHLARST